MRGPSSFEDLAAVIAVCLGTARADGKFKQVELDRIVEALKSQYNFEGRDDLLQSYIDAAEEMDYSEAIGRIKNFSDEEKQFVSDMLFVTICADGESSPEEVEVYRNMVNICELPLFTGAENVETDDNDVEEEEQDEKADDDDAIIPAFIVVNFYGIASLKQSENEDWRNLEDEFVSWLGCEGGTQVVRFTQRLNAISEALNLNGYHLVFLMARRGYGDRTVGDNMPATILYGGGNPIYGNIIFALETDKGYEVEGFRSRRLLNEAYAVINEAIGGLMRTE